MLIVQVSGTCQQWAPGRETPVRIQGLRCGHNNQATRPLATRAWRHRHLPSHSYHQLTSFSFSRIVRDKYKNKIEHIITNVLTQRQVSLTDLPEHDTSVIPSHCCLFHLNVSFPDSPSHISHLCLLFHHHNSARSREFQDRRRR